MPNDRNLANAPLVEVIAEVHWALPGDAQMTNHDPNWFKMAIQLEPAVASRLPVVEHLHPAGFIVPLDVLGRAPILRFRPTNGSWPLAQFGQGIMTVNAVPPYDGWTAVRDLLSYTLTTAAAASPLFASVKPERLKLLYRDAFTDQHGVHDLDDFLVNQIGLVNQVGLNTLSKVVGAASEAHSAEIKADISHMPNSSVSVRGSRGQVKASTGLKNAAVVDIAVNGNSQLTTMDINAILSWFDAAHEVAWATFCSLVPPTVMNNLKEG